MQFLFRHSIIGLFCAAVTSLWTVAAAGEDSQILAVGVFHFANPGLDVVKTEQINVMAEDNQRYLERLTGRFAEFAPTHVLLECEEQAEEQLNEEFQRFLDDDFKLAANELYQLGFRIGRKAGLDTLNCYDTRSVPWLAGELFAYMAENDAEAERRFNALIEEITEKSAANHRSMSMQELMLLHNDPEEDRVNKGLYLLTNEVGAGNSYVGADAAASWWHRNFRMYANIQELAAPDTRLIVIGGQGHTAILKDLIQIDPDRDLLSVESYLRD